MDDHGRGIEKKLLARSGKRGLIWVLGIVVATFSVVMGLAFFISKRFEEEFARVDSADLRQSEEVVARQVGNDINGIQSVLFAIKGLFDGSEEVTKTEFDTFSETLRLKETYPSLLSVSYIEVVDEVGRLTLGKKIAADYPGRGIFPEGNKGVGYIVRYEFPVRSQKLIIGFDITSDLIRKAVMDQARDTGKPAMSATFKSIVDENANVFLVAMPIYRRGANLKTVLDRREALVGFTGALYLGDVFFGTAIDNMHLSNLKVKVFGGKLSDVKKAFDVSSLLSGSITDWKTYDFLGQSWSFLYSYKRSDIFPNSTMTMSTAILLVGVMIAVLFTIVNLTLFQARRKALRMAMKMTEEMVKFKLAVENASNGVVITDVVGKILYANSAVTKLTGYSHDEVLGQLPSLWGGEEDRGTYEDIYRQVVEEKKTYRGVLTSKKKSGELCTMSIMISPIYSEENELMGFVGIGEDISEKVKTEEALKYSEERFRSMIEKSSDVVTLLDGKGDVIFESPSTLHVLGFKPEELLGRFSYTRVHPDDVENFKILFEKLISRFGEVVRYTFRFQHKNGNWLWLESVTTNALNVPGIRALISNYRDITDRKMAELALEEQTHFLEREKTKAEAIVNSIGEGVVVLDQDGKVTLVNAEAVKMFGKEPHEMMGKVYTDIWDVEDGLGNKVVNRPIQQTLSTGKVISSGDYFYSRKYGNSFPVFLTVAPLIQEGKVVGAVDVFRDITREKAVDKARNEFVSLASHQLRTPLSAVNWYAEMLLSGDTGAIDPNQKKYLEEIYGANRRMVELVNSLLNVSRVDLGTFAIEPEDLSIEKVTRSVVGELKPDIDNKKINLVENYDSNLSMIKADPQLTRIIIQNLLTNAVKYTGLDGKVEVEIKHLKSGDAVGTRVCSDDSILIRVTDNGYGIPVDQQDKIFSKLFRADNIKTKDTEGTGLGLYIVKSIIDAVGGSIWFDSKEDLGTTFYVLLPMKGMQKRSGSKPLV